MPLRITLAGCRESIAAAKKRIPVKTEGPATPIWVNALFSTTSMAFGRYGPPFIFRSLHNSGTRSLPLLHSHVADRREPTRPIGRHHTVASSHRPPTSGTTPLRCRVRGSRSQVFAKTSSRRCRGFRVSVAVNLIPHVVSATGDLGIERRLAGILQPCDKVARKVDGDDRIGVAMKQPKGNILDEVGLRWTDPDRRGKHLRCVRDVLGGVHYFRPSHRCSKDFSYSHTKAAQLTQAAKSVTIEKPSRTKLNPDLYTTTAKIGIELKMIERSTRIILRRYSRNVCAFCSSRYTSSRRQSESDRSPSPRIHFVFGSHDKPNFVAASEHRSLRTPSRYSDASAKIDSGIHGISSPLFHWCLTSSGVKKISNNQTAAMNPQTICSATIDVVFMRLIPARVASCLPPAKSYGLILDKTGR